MGLCVSQLELFLGSILDFFLKWLHANVYLFEMHDWLRSKSCCMVFRYFPICWMYFSVETMSKLHCNNVNRRAKETRRDLRCQRKPSSFKWQTPLHSALQIKLKIIPGFSTFFVLKCSFFYKFSLQLMHFPLLRRCNEVRVARQVGLGGLPSWIQWRNVEVCEKGQSLHSVQCPRSPGQQPINKRSITVSPGRIWLLLWTVLRQPLVRIIFALFLPLYF